MVAIFPISYFSILPISPTESEAASVPCERPRLRTVRPDRQAVRASTAQPQGPEIPHIRERRWISGTVEPHRGADQHHSVSRPFGRSTPSGRDHDAIRGAVYGPKEAVRISE